MKHKWGKDSIMKKNNRTIITTIITASLLLISTECSQPAEVVKTPDIITDSTAVTTINTEAEKPKTTTAATTAAQTTAHTTTQTTTAAETTVITTAPVTEAPPVTKQTEAPAPVITTTTTKKAAPVVTTTTTTAAPVVTTTTPEINNNYKYEQSLKVAEELAEFVKETAGNKKSLKQIACAAEAVYYNFYQYCEYSQSEEDDWTAYGVFITHKASCQGAADALGMVLNILGYKWEHINKNLYTHQWCKVYFEYSQEVETKEGETKTITDSVVYADASVPIQALIGIGGEYGEDALLFSYYDFVTADETGVLHENTCGVIF